MFPSEFNQLLVLNPTGANENHTVSCVIRLDVRRQVIPFDGQNVGFRSEYGSAERLIFRKSVYFATELKGGQCSLWNATACRWSKTTSSNCLSTSCCSRNITSRSLSIALLSNFEFCRMSLIISTALGTSLRKLFA